MSKAEELLEEMRNNPKGNYTAQDYRTVYVGFGFTYSNEGCHTGYTHEGYHDVWATVKKSKPKSPAYARDAVDRIEKVKARQLQDRALPKQEEAKNEQSKTPEQQKSRKKRARR